MTLQRSPRHFRLTCGRQEWRAIMIDPRQSDRSAFANAFVDDLSKLATSAAASTAA